MMDVVVKIDSVQVLPDSESVSFEARKGSVICLFGMNGTGKTLLLKTICGIFLPHSGSAEVLVSRSSQGVCLQFPEHLVFQETALAEAILVTGGEQQALVLLNEIGVMPEQMPFFMSDGQKRLMFLYGYLETKDLLLFDEPFASLDEDTKQKVTNKIKNAATQGKTVIFTANRAADTAQADEIIEIRRRESLIGTV